MKNRILNYRQNIDTLLDAADESKNEKNDWEEIIKEHLVQISFFQHERLIHLIVTITFAILEMISLGLVMIEVKLFLLILIVLFLVLLIPYIWHYYLLENETQKMYGQYDRMRKHLEGK